MAAVVSRINCYGYMDHLSIIDTAAYHPILLSRLKYLRGLNQGPFWELPSAQGQVPSWRQPNPISG